MSTYENMSRNDGIGPITIGGNVSEGADFGYGATKYLSRVLLVNADGTIDVEFADGTALADLQVFKGYNPVSVRKITALNGLTVQWGA